MQYFLQDFIGQLKNTTVLEFIAVVTGIASVWYSRKENILVYPVGLINTTIYIYLSLKGDLIGEASVNLYYTIMSIVGWIAWLRKDEQKSFVLHITWSDRKMWINQLLFFGFFYVAIFFALTYLKRDFAPDAIP